MTDTVGAANDNVGLEGSAGAVRSIGIGGRAGEDASGGVAVDTLACLHAQKARTYYVTGGVCAIAVETASMMKAAMDFILFILLIGRFDVCFLFGLVEVGSLYRTERLWLFDGSVTSVDFSRTNVGERDFRLLMKLNL